MKKKVTVSICMSKDFEIEVENEESNLRQAYLEQHYLPNLMLEEGTPPAGMPWSEVAGWIIDDISVIE